MIEKNKVSGQVRKFSNKRQSMYKTGKPKLFLHELPIGEKPRERLFLNGAGKISDHELCTILIGSGMKGRDAGIIAEEVLGLIDRKNGTLSIEELRDIRGLGNAKAALFCASLELARRYSISSSERIAFPGDVLPLIRHFADRKQEHFLSVSLNGAHELIRCRVVSIGLVNRTLIHPREVFSDPLTDRAAAVIVAHNHPSGNVKPSEEDKSITKRLSKAGDTLGIQLLDHIIFSRLNHYSFLENGVL